MLWPSVVLTLMVCWSPVAVDAHTDNSPAINSPGGLQSVPPPLPIAVDVPVPVQPVSAAPEASSVGPHCVSAEPRWWVPDRS
jgi:hypothetical protein